MTRVAVVGGGPAGLLAAVLLARAHHEVTVWDRDEGPGLGVVLPAEALRSLADADPQVGAAVARAAVRWDTIDTVVEGRSYPCRGHEFSSIGRGELLAILRGRARSLGVRFGGEAPPVQALDAGLVIAADGVHSAIRESGGFGVTRHAGRCHYAWYGTELPLTSFTFWIAETPHGPVVAHAYPHAPGASTVVVEARSHTWAALALDTPMSCEDVLSGLLRGHRLTGDPERRTFTTIRAATWVRGNVVLLGDAAHTTHFSTGSGTRLAFDDAIALAAALDREPDVAIALKSYEDARRPAVASAQRAATASQEWFEELAGRRGADPRETVFGLLTRSRRITHASLAVRDREFTAAVERGFGGAVPMLTPFTVRGLTLANRVVVSPTALYSADDGLAGDFHLVHLGSRALGGAGLVMTEMVAVSADARISPGCAGLYTDGHTAAWRRITDFTHANSGARVGLQLGHAGRKGSTRRRWEGDGEPLPDGNWPLIAPSPLPYLPSGQVPREMTAADLRQVRQDFARAASRAVDAGFDLLELHLAHGYLLSSFLTPLANRRSDSYGVNRARFPLEVVAAVREVWPGPLAARVSATDWVPGGLTGDDAVELASLLVSAGVDLVDVSTGQTSPDARPAYGRGYQVPFSERVRREAGVPTIAVGAISSADDVNTILLAGRADLCALGRPHLADPAWTLHAAAAAGYPVGWPVQYEPATPRNR